MKCIKITNR